MSEVLPVIVATAGHVDHGKTALVEALTGCNTDRLPQEKERGLSIDIGFAKCQLTKGTSIGIVDLPGHEDYIKNMVAGAASAKILLLVIASDESVMPQTREHLQIVSQLTDARIILVITKVDLVDKDYLDIVKEDALRLLDDFGLYAEQVHFTSVRSMVGLASLRDGINELALKCVDSSDRRDFRVFVERNFIARGHGIVVTGIGISGKISVGDSLILNGREVRVRGIECYSKRVDEATSGQCLAINLDYNGSGENKVDRGSVLHHASYASSSEFIVSIKNISKEYTYNKVTKCRVHVGTLSCNASVKLFGCSELGYGDGAFAHLKLEKKSVLSSGDNFLIRVARPFGSVGGGVILSSEGGYRLSNKDKFRHSLFRSALEAVDKKLYLLSELLAGSKYIFSRSDIERLGHVSDQVLQDMITSMVDSKDLIMVSRNVWLLEEKTEAFARFFEKELLQYHMNNKYRLGMNIEHVARVLAIPVDGVERVVKIIAKFVKVDYSDGVVASKDFEPDLKDNALMMYKVISESVRIEPALWLALGEVKDQCRVSKKDSQEVIKILCSEEKIHLIAGKFIVSAVEVARLIILLNEAFVKVDLLEIGYWRELTGLSRNHAVATLEYFDDINITRRVESGRVKRDN